MTEGESLLEIGETYYLLVRGLVGDFYIGWILEGFSESGENVFLKGVDGGDMTTPAKILEERAFTEVTDEIEKI